ncbi:MAG: SDR family NAD(P)-dependent oxidoreductase [Roseburia sp.]|nr:SDR family NAD(P)-dependent oxidoreductase [Roseburia sp.]
MKNVIVIGGSSGIGLALCQCLIERGANVINISRTPCAVAHTVNLEADVKDAVSLKKAFEAIEYTDALVYCAGTSIAAPVEHVKTEDYREIFDVNILGAIECCKLALPLLKRAHDKGRIVLVGSTGGSIPIAFDAYYSATKAALDMFSRAIRLETDGVLCTTVVVGGTRTQFSFKRKIYDDCGEYAKNVRSAANRLIKIEQTGYPAIYIAQKIADILQAKAPPPTVTLGIKNKLQTAVFKLLPQRLEKPVLRFIYGIKF